MGESIKRICTNLAQFSAALVAVCFRARSCILRVYYTYYYQARCCTKNAYLSKKKVQADFRNIQSQSFLHFSNRVQMDFWTFGLTLNIYMMFKVSPFQTFFTQKGLFKIKRTDFEYSWQKLIRTFDNPENRHYKIHCILVEFEHQKRLLRATGKLWYCLGPF